MPNLSININKIATLRNSRGGDIPNIEVFAKDIQRYGSHGITIHPRPDERHIRYKDVYNLKPIVNVEFNIEGNPTDKFMDLVLSVKPTQVTLVPDTEDAITSNAGWDTISHETHLRNIVKSLKLEGIRTSIFVDPKLKIIEGAAKIETDRVELYTGSYAKEFTKNRSKAISDYVECGKIASILGLGVNAGHDLNLNNVGYFNSQVSQLLEVSIGHAFVCESLYFGMENVIGMYLHRLNPS